jgi:hypothetical protein
MAAEITNEAQYRAAEAELNRMIEATQDALIHPTMALQMDQVADAMRAYEQRDVVRWR